VITGIFLRTNLDEEDMPMSRMEAPESGVKVRMYRQGHGDCFLLAFPDADDNPVYMLVDCGYKPGSQVHDNRIDAIVENIAEATGKHLHVVLITHEHQDHVNGFWNKFFGNAKEYFTDFEVDQLWMAWTENPLDPFANELRERFNDTLLGLMEAQRRLAASPGNRHEQAAFWLKSLLEFELGSDEDEASEPSLKVEGSLNKEAMKFMKEKSKLQLYLEPHGPLYRLPSVPDVMIYALGPPRDERLLLSPDPIGEEGFATEQSFALSEEATYFFAAVQALVEGSTKDEAQPFAHRYRISEKEAFKGLHREFFENHYGAEATDREDSWRRIDHEWLHTAERLALRLNNEVNNTSLVVAIELPKSRKVLLFVGDAQRGNWVSWDKGTWTQDDGSKVTAGDLLGRTVLYKVGHHGSHNATLNGSLDSPYPSLGWMAQGSYAEEFVAMIPAHGDWASSKNRPWQHPLPSIETALMEKAKGRVFRTDIDHVPQALERITKADWETFQARVVEEKLYFEYTIPDE
jgi:beta-lactamase superfamily II metal-dependent hydrolase